MFSIFTVPCPVSAAYKGLDSLGDPCEHGGHHQGQVRNDPIGSHPCIACQPQDHQIEYNEHDP